MNHIAAETCLSNVLKNNPIVFIDLCYKKQNIDSYEKIKNLIISSKNLYKGHIDEFYREIEELQRQIDSVINAIISKSDVSLFDVDGNIVESVVSDKINNALGTVSYYQRQKDLKFIFADSYTINPETSYNAICQVYAEHGYDFLVEYIDLINNPTNFIAYMNDDKRQLVAMEYMLYKTNHHGVGGKKYRRYSSKNASIQFQEAVDGALSDITEKKAEYSSFVEEKQKEYLEWKGQAEKKLSDIMATYGEKLKVEKPAEFMKEKSEEYKKSFQLFAIISIIISIAIALCIGLLMSPSIEVLDRTININFFSRDIGIPAKLILLALVSFGIYILRIFIKITLSSKHLSDEYYQKHALTYFYLALVYEGKIDKETGNAILVSLFSRIDTGLIKESSTSSLDIGKIAVELLAKK